MLIHGITFLNIAIPLWHGVCNIKKSEHRDFLLDTPLHSELHINRRRRPSQAWSLGYCESTGDTMCLDGPNKFNLALHGYELIKPSAVDELCASKPLSDEPLPGIEGDCT